jgi:peptidoglycan/LPS O-acetylase OafA/YrhL
LACSLSIWEFPLLVNAFWQYLGKISYSVYLTHWAVLWPLSYWIQPADGSRYVSLPRLGLVFLLEVPLAMLVSTATYYLIEQPGQELGKRIIKRLEQAPQPRTPAYVEDVS